MRRIVPSIYSGSANQRGARQIHERSSSSRSRGAQRCGNDKLAGTSTERSVGVRLSDSYILVYLSVLI